MALAHPRMTALEFLALPEAPFQHQLIDGELIVNEPRLPHQVAATNLAVALTIWRRAASGRGFASIPADFQIDDHNVFAPDLWWVAEARRPQRGQLAIEGLPDLIVEVRSPSTWRYDIGRKKRRYEEGGVAELWLVDTVGVVLVYRRSEPSVRTFDVELELDEETVLTSPLLPGFALPVREIFEP
jgi:Uma2 family endonuclease